MLYVGLDIHSKHVAPCVLSEAGQLAQRAKARGIEEMPRTLRALPDRFEVCYEAGRGYGHFHSGRTPRSGMAQGDAAGVNEGSRILPHGAPPGRVMPNGCLGCPVLVLLFWP